MKIWEFGENLHDILSGGERIRIRLALVRERYEYGGARFTTMTWRFKITSDYRRWKKEDELNNIPACEFNPIADYITLMFGSNSNRRFHYRVYPAQTSARSSAIVHVQAESAWFLEILTILKWKKVEYKLIKTVP